MNDARLNLIVLRAANIRSTAAFYQQIGLHFSQEQSRSSPVYFACVIGSTIIEIHPGQPGSAPGLKQAGATRLGFATASLDQVLAHINPEAIRAVAKPQAAPWHKCAVLVDPDGRAVELTQAW